MTLRHHAAPFRSHERREGAFPSTPVVALDERLYEVGRALASRQRIAVLRALADGNASVGELVARTGEADMLYHLEVLGEAGLVATGIDGTYGLASLDVLVLVHAIEAVARSRQ
jgi:DNA-binding transcriptional ArsR family regulator